MKRSLQNQWIGLNHFFKIHQIMAVHGKNLMLTTIKYEKKVIKDGSTSLWNYAEELNQ